MRHVFLRLGLAAGLGLACAQWAFDSTVYAQGITPQDAALLRFNRGRTLFSSHNYQAALEEFRAALGLVPSPNTRLYIGRCLHELGRNAEAYLELQRAGAEAADRATTEPRYATTRDSARREAEALVASFGYLELSVRDHVSGEELRVNGSVVPEAAWTLPSPFDPGRVMIEVTAPGYLPFRTEATITATQHTTVNIPSLEAEPRVVVVPDAGSTELNTPVDAGTTTSTDAGPMEVPVAPDAGYTERTVGGGLRFLGIGLAVVGVGGGITFGVAGTLAQNRYDELVQRGCAPQFCDASLSPLIDDGEMLQTLANVGLGVGIGGLVLGGVLIAAGGPKTVWIGPDGRERPAPTQGSSEGTGVQGQRTTPIVVPWAQWLPSSTGSSGAMLGVTGVF